MRTDSAIKLVNTNDPVYNKLTVGEDGNRVPTDKSVLRYALNIKYQPKQLDTDKLWRLLG